MLPFSTLFTVILLLSIVPAPRAAQPVATPEAGITGLVLTPDGSPVTQGNVRWPRDGAVAGANG